ncbi:MAG TPA: hypothetical protein VFE47_08715 [Tepidisphaeraceae bacterium]|nr:hypothetical protein [Tepidisphaeraceae bacterium]
MTDRGDFILVDAAQVGGELAGILDAVENGHRRIQIVRDGKVIAEVTPPARRILRPSNKPKLKVTFSPEYDPCEGLSEDDWPEHLR